MSGCCARVRLWYGGFAVGVAWGYDFVELLISIGAPAKQWVPGAHLQQVLNSNPSGLQRTAKGLLMTDGVTWEHVSLRYAVLVTLRSAVP